MTTINILSPLIGRYYTAYDYFNQIKRIIDLNPEIKFNWIINDASKDPAFKKMIDDTGIPNIYLTYCGEARDYEYRDQSDDLSVSVAETNNRMVKAMPPCDYALLIEDDIICQNENPIPLMLAGFEDDKIGAVCACLFAKRLTDRFGVIQGLKIVNGRFEPIEYKDDGYTRVNATAFGYIMFRYDLLGEKPFEHHYGGHLTSVDLSYGWKLYDLGYDINYAWGVKIWHYYKTKDGIVGVANDKNRRKTDKERQMVLKQIDRKGSPMFIYKPKI